MCYTQCQSLSGILLMFEKRWTTSKQPLFTDVKCSHSPRCLSFSLYVTGHTKHLFYCGQRCGLFLLGYCFFRHFILFYSIQNWTWFYCVCVHALTICGSCPGWHWGQAWQLLLVWLKNSYSPQLEYSALANMQHTWREGDKPRHYTHMLQSHT